MAPSTRWRAPVHHFSFKYLIIVPVLLSIATIVMLFIHSDVNVAMLWSQCHSRARIPGLSRIPGIGTPLCYLISFFQTALNSVRSTVIMAVILAFVGGLLTVSTVEAARICNAPNVLIAYPTGPWLVFNLIGGAVVWELLIIPAFLHRARMVYLARNKRDDETQGDHLPMAQENSRHLPESEIVAIPVSIAIGFFVPSVLMLILKSPTAIGVWLFFPIYVSLLRQSTRKLVTYLRSVDPSTIHIESSWWSLGYIYAVPVLCSVLAHFIALGNVTRPDDRKEMTRSTLTFIEIDVLFIFFTVLYWMLVEVGWQVPLATIASSIVAGPGAGFCAGWIYREGLIHDIYHGESDIEDSDDEPAEGRTNEETPLLS